MSACHMTEDNFSLDKLEELIENLGVLTEYWKKCQFSFTHKVHLLVDHMPYQIRLMKGGGDIEESYIKRFHQIRGRFAKRILGLQSDKCLNQYKTEHQSVSMNEDIKQC